jgi:hypothetical protein
MAFYISGPKLLFETTEISTHPNSTQQESNYIYLYTTKFGTSIKIWLNRKFESTEFETVRVNCICYLFNTGLWSSMYLEICFYHTWVRSYDWHYYSQRQSYFISSHIWPLEVMWHLRYKCTSEVLRYASSRNLVVWIKCGSLRIVDILRSLSFWNSIIFDLSILYTYTIYYHLSH